MAVLNRTSSLLLVAAVGIAKECGLSRLDRLVWAVNAASTQGVGAVADRYARTVVDDCGGALLVLAASAKAALMAAWLRDVARLFNEPEAQAEPWRLLMMVLTIGYARHEVSGSVSEFEAMVRGLASQVRSVTA